MSRPTSPSRRFDKLGAFLDLAAAPGDSPELRRRKRMAVVLPAMTVLVVPFFVAGFLLVGQWHAALPPALAVIGMLGQLAWLRGTRRLGAVPTITLAMVLLMTGAGHVLGGGFVGSGAVILWSIFAPIWALALVGRQAARVTMLGFVALLLALALAEPQLRGLGSPLPAAARGPMLALNFLLVGVSLFVVLGRFVDERDRALARVSALLHNVLPPSIADRLEADPEGVIADRHESVTILFADIVGFTALSARLSAEETVALLNQIFSAFDGFCAQAGVEKIKTIGDGYMAVCGAPGPVPDHALVVAKVAIQMRDYMATDPTNHALRVRIGISTGSAIAAIVGSARLQWDLWSNAVNVAARMESTGAPGRIQISRSTWERIGAHLPCESRGLVEVKGKGELETWFIS